MALLEIISYAGDNTEIVTRSEIENFNSKSQLIVNESQEALFFKDGQALDLFPAGKYSLSTGNFPLLKKLVGLAFGGKTPFTCCVYFINKVNVMDMMWGTDSPIQLEDPKYHLLVNVRANGTLGFRVVDSRKFVVKCVAQLHEFTTQDIKKNIKGVLMAHIKNSISKTIVRNNVSLLEISTLLVDLSKDIQDEVNRVIKEEYGIELIQFYLNNISAPDSDLQVLRETREKQMRTMSDIDLEAYKTERMGQAMARSRQAQGYTYQDERRFDVLDDAASNSGLSGSMMNATMGIGMGIGVGSGMGQMMKDTAEVMKESAPEAPKNGVKCSKCGAEILGNAKFCPECGSPVVRDKFCINCGTKLQPGAKFCPECGTKQE